MAKAISHGLGMGNGGISDLGDGDIEYRATGKLLPSFRVNIADVTGFAVRRPGKLDKGLGASSMQQIFSVIGGGTELAACAVNYGTSAKIEAWIRAQPLFGKNVSHELEPHAQVASRSMSEELVKLAGLRDAGVLSDEEFGQAKSKLLS